MIRPFVALIAFVAAAATLAAGGEYKVIIKDHVFVPATIEVPAGEKLVLIVENQDATPEEFESHSLKREKIIAGGATARIKLGPLKAGEYKFFGEFNEKTAQGTLVVK